MEREGIEREGGGGDREGGRIYSVKDNGIIHRNKDYMH